MSKSPYESHRLPIAPPVAASDNARVTRIGIDIGGTFTDLYALSKGGKSWSTKLLTTPRDPSVGFLEILAKARGEDLQEIVHATTVATNAILEGKTARMGLITTAGFRDVLEIGRHFRRD